MSSQEAQLPVMQKITALQAVLTCGLFRQRRFQSARLIVKHLAHATCVRLCILEAEVRRNGKNLLEPTYGQVCCEGWQIVSDQIRL